MSTGAKRITGKFYIKLNGKLLPITGDATLKLGGQSRETVIGNEVLGFREKAVAPEVDCTFVHNQDVDLKGIGSMDNVTITVATDTDVVYTIANAWCVDPPELSSKGEAKFKFSGVLCK